MKVLYSKKFEDQFLVHSNLEKIVSDFQAWKESSTPENSLGFGKDGGYRNPRLDNGGYLMHVHTPPTNKEARDQWILRAKRGSERTSNNAIVYVKRSDTEYLILWQFKNNAHLVPEMTTSEDKAFMQRLVEVANHFIDHGEVLESLRTRFRRLFDGYKK